MPISTHVRLALLSGLIATQFLGCAHQKPTSIAISRPGEIRGNVEATAFPGTADSSLPSNPANSVSQNSETSPRIDDELGDEVFVLLEPVDFHSPHQSSQDVQTISIRPERKATEIQLVVIDRPLQFQNRDSIYHELFTTTSNNSIRVRLAGKSASAIFHLTEPGLVRLYCVLHPNEIHTFIASSGGAHSAVVDSKMRFRFSNIRPGAYRVRAVSALDWGRSQTVRLGASETIELNLKLASRQTR